MAQNGRGYNGRFTAAQCIEAIPGTGGIVSALATRLGCSWNTARGCIDRWPTVHRAWQDERAKITDKAQSNVVKAILDEDLQTSKWWLQLMDPDFTPKSRMETLLRHLDMTKLSTGQLERIAAGEDPFHVLADAAAG